MRNLLILLVFVYVGINRISCKELNFEVAAQWVVENVPAEIKSPDLRISAGLCEHSNELLLMVDPTPMANWAHPVVYYYFEKEWDGEIIRPIKVENQKFPPNIKLSIIYDKRMDDGLVRSNDPYIPHIVVKRDVPIAKNQYAIILSGGRNIYSNNPRYWNDCSFIYSVLRNHYNVPQSNIYIAMSDGVDPAPDYSIEPGGLTFSQDLDLDGDGNNDVNFAATLSDLAIIFEELKTKLTPDDQLLIYVIDHGDFDEELKSSYICLWNEQRLYPPTLNEWICTLEAGSINCIFGQCYSGGFITPLQGKNRVISTACTEDELSYARNEHYDAFVEAWTFALLNDTFFNFDLVNSPDTDGNGKINMLEAFNFAHDNDVRGPKFSGSEHPQFFTGKKILAETLIMAEIPILDDLLIRDSILDLGDESKMSKYINDSPDMWIRKSNDGLQIHQQVSFSNPGIEENFVYVRIHNNGLRPYEPSVYPRYLHLNWTYGGLMHDWEAYTGVYQDIFGRIIGSPIKTILLDKEIEPGESHVFCVPWKSTIAEIDTNGEPISILATISDDSKGLQYDMYRNYYNQPLDISHKIPVKENNCIAIKNEYSPSSFNLNKNQWSVPVYLQRPLHENRYYSISFEKGDEVSIYDKLSIHLTPPENITCVIPQSSNVAEYKEPKTIIIDGNTDFDSEEQRFGFFTLPDNDLYKFDVTATLKNVDWTLSTPVKISMLLKEYPTDEIVGAYYLTSFIQRRRFEVSKSQINVSKGDSERMWNIELLSHERPLKVEWLNSDGDVIGVGTIITVDAEYIPKVYLKAEYEDLVFTDEITLPEQLYIKDINKVGNELYGSLNYYPGENTVLHLISMEDPIIQSYLRFTNEEREFKVELDKFNSDTIIVNLEKEGRILSSFKIK
ncbi:MAG: C13 family peptidase [Muribaculaceae bacterium]|nr:C13 family peptidase [Muribaculaceae bacterium]